MWVSRWRRLSCIFSEDWRCPNKRDTALCSFGSSNGSSVCPTLGNGNGWFEHPFRGVSSLFDWRKSGILLSQGELFREDCVPRNRYMQGNLRVGPVDLVAIPLNGWYCSAIFSWRASVESLLGWDRRCRRYGVPRRKHSLGCRSLGRPWRCCWRWTIVGDLGRCWSPPPRRLMEHD